MLSSNLNNSGPALTKRGIGYRQNAAKPARLGISNPVIDVSDSRFIVKLAQTTDEIDAVLKLRYKIFNVELGAHHSDEQGIETDGFDLDSHHLIAVERVTKRVVGAYRLRAVEIMTGESGFYSSQEFDLSGLPASVLKKSLEIGRACIDIEYRNSRVLFLLWQGLASYVLQTRKSYLFGACSIFTTDEQVGLRAYKSLMRGGQLHESFKVKPKRTDTEQAQSLFETSDDREIELPKLFTSYLKIGAKVCSPPVIDIDFGTTDFFVIFEVNKIDSRYYKLFFETQARKAAA